jgi:lipopolysaccharide biosynthesis glycosyltransferase
MIEERAMEAFIKKLKITSANYSDMLRKLFSIYFIYCQILIAQLVKAQKIIQ